MKHFPLLLAALMGLAVSMPAQSARYGRQHRGQIATVRSASHHVARRAVPVATQRSAQRSRVARSGFVGRTVRSCAPRVFGRWELRCEQVLVPGFWETRSIPAVHGWVFDACGFRVWGVVTPARCERFWVPARYETQQRRVWVRY